MQFTLNVKSPSNIYVVVIIAIFLKDHVEEVSLNHKMIMQFSHNGISLISWRMPQSVGISKLKIARYDASSNYNV